MPRRALLDTLRLTEERLLHMLARDRNDPDWGLFAPVAEVRKFPMLQCLLHPLAALVTDRALESPLYGEEIPIRWAKASLFALPLLQERSGAYGEGAGRPFTGLLAAHGALALRALKPCLTADETTRLEVSLARAAAWCRRRTGREPDFLRLAEQAIALHEVFLLTGDRTLDAASNDALVRLCRMQGAEGNLHPPGTPFDVKRHFILAELVARRHYLDKSAASRALLKGALHLLRHLQRPDGSLENETFGAEDFFAPPGHLLSIRREVQGASALVDGLLSATVARGRRTLPFLDRQTFACSLTRLVATVKLLAEPHPAEPAEPAPEPERRVYLASLPALVVTAPAYRAFVNPATGGLKVYSRRHDDGPLVYADSGFLIEAGGEVYRPRPADGRDLASRDDRFDFALRLEGRRPRLPFARAKTLRGERTLRFRDDGIDMTASFDPGEAGAFREPLLVFRVYRRLNRFFSADDLTVATREDVAARTGPDGRSLMVRETLRLEGGRWKILPDDPPAAE